MAIMAAYQLCTNYAGPDEDADEEEVDAVTECQMFNIRGEKPSKNIWSTNA